MNETVFSTGSSGAFGDRAVADARRAVVVPGSCAAGFSLVEVMVALVIGMLGIIVMMQMFSVFEGQKRTTTGGDDAISSGSVSLYGLQRDIQQAGWGTSAIPLIGCSVSGLTAGGGSVPFAPVTINPALPTPQITGQDPNTDTLLVVSGNGNGTVEGDLIMSISADLRSYVVDMPSVFAPGSFAVASPRLADAGACTRNATTVSTVTASVQVAAAATFAVAQNDRLFDLGANPVVRVYAVRGGNLTVCNWRVDDCALPANNNNADVWVPIANNVVSLRAQYGRDTAAGAMDGIFDVWDKTLPATTTPISTDTSKNLPGCARARIPAVRLAVVARSSQPERPSGGTAVTTITDWMGSDPAAVGVNAVNAAAVAIVPPSPDNTWPTWQDFRYKVFETVVPLRNITSPGVLEQC